MGNAKMAKEFDVTKHELVPKHVKVEEREKKELLEKYKISIYNLPFLRKNDPAIKHLDVQAGDIIKIIRDSSKTAGRAAYYRYVVKDEGRHVKG
jgi:DNA-directed RNA polymerase subunit H (RpoH/RPB5)